MCFHLDIFRYWYNPKSFFPDCQKQLSECRENLEQLEGFQSQELSKVKHMLLSAETALEAETKERKRAQAEADGLREERGARADREGGERRRMQAELDAARAEHEARMEEARAGHEAQIARLEERLGHQVRRGHSRQHKQTAHRTQFIGYLECSYKIVHEIYYIRNVVYASLQLFHSQL